MDTDSTRWLKLRSGSEIRGPEGLLTDDVAQKVGYAFACWLAERDGTTPDALKLAVGHDPRPSGARLKAALVRGITAADSDVLDCGLCAAPALFMTCQGEADGAVMVTVSAASEKLNGLRFITAKGGLRDEDVAEVLRRAARTQVPERLVVPHDAAAPYWDALRRAAAAWLEDDALKPLLGMRVVVDGRGGAGRDYMDFLASMGVEVEGSLPAEEGFLSDPFLPAAQKAVGRAVVENKADLGALFSASGDCAVLLDGEGRAVNPNRLIALISALLLNEKAGSTIVTDSVTSTGLTAFIAEWGGVHYRFKRGYRYVIDEAIRLNDEGIDCPLAIETSGHAAFRENGFLDDGFYLVTRLICEALNRKREGQSLFDLLEGLREPVESVELRLPVLDEEDPSAASQEIVEALLSHTLENPAWQPAPDSREGVRITFNLDGGINNAWLQLRMSVHDPVMVLNAESDLPGGVKRILKELYALIGETELLDLELLRKAIEA